jgi:hypothetical protein
MGNTNETVTPERATTDEQLVHTFLTVVLIKVKRSNFASRGELVPFRPQDFLKIYCSFV